MWNKFFASRDCLLLPSRCQWGWMWSWSFHLPALWSSTSCIGKYISTYISHQQRGESWLIFWWLKTWQRWARIWESASASGPARWSIVWTENMVQTDKCCMRRMSHQRQFISGRMGLEISGRGYAKCTFSANKGSGTRNTGVWKSKKNLVVCLTWGCRQWTGAQVSGDQVSKSSPVWKCGKPGCTKCKQ